MDTQYIEVTHGLALPGNKKTVFINTLIREAPPQ